MRANYEIVGEDEEYIHINDLGPWDRFMTVTNDAESVVADVVARIGADKMGRRNIAYRDSEGQRTVLRVVNGEFVGFAPFSR